MVQAYYRTFLVLLIVSLSVIEQNADAKAKARHKRQVHMFSKWPLGRTIPIVISQVAEKVHTNLKKLIHKSPVIGTDMKRIVNNHRINNYYFNII